MYVTFGIDSYKHGHMKLVTIEHGINQCMFGGLCLSYRCDII
jgi:hypothetical protein